MATATTTRRPASKESKGSPQKKLPVMMAVNRNGGAGGSKAREDGDEGATAAGSNRESLEKVRDILFGAQMRDSDQRFNRIEDRLAKEVVDIREESRKRIETLEAFVRKELQTLGERLKGEQTQRAEALREVSQELKETAKTIEKRLAEANDLTVENQRNLRQELLDQSKVLREEVQQSAQTVLVAVERSLGDLRSEKIDRAAVADLFSEMALRLSEGNEKPSRR